MVDKESVMKEVVDGHTRERTIEVPFIFRNLEGQAILDVGCLESSFCEGLAKLGYSMTGIDIRPYPPNTPLPSTWTWMQEDARHLSLKCGIFDQAVAISTLEHVGLERAYDINNVVKGYVPSMTGDRESLLEMFRVTKNRGSLLVTLPVGFPDHYWMRLYSKERLDKLLEGFNAEVKEFYIENREGKWIQSSTEDAFSQNSQPMPRACVCLRLRV
jgi:2-polyprenyl-3-methyl-5-hydroxy-6-metoxy-1,4-benzoquinol methylase